MLVPTVIQGGMGVYISTPFLANVCSRLGVLGTVSCVNAEQMLARILQSGDLGGHYRRALSHFPFGEVAERIIKKYFLINGIYPDQKYKRVPAWSMEPRRDLIELAIAASFCFVWLAKEGNDNPISVNYLEKIQIPHIYHLTGAMLAGVDYVTMGAGITLQIPSVLDAIAFGKIPDYRVTVLVDGKQETFISINFNPNKFFGGKLPEMERPSFLPIISSNLLAEIMVNKLPPNSIQGFVVESSTAGGHNAPPRVKGVFDEIGQPVYGQKDAVSFKKLQDLGIPFWIAGSFASPEAIIKAQKLGAVGIQAGSIFALSENSGMNPDYRRKIRYLGYRNELVVHTDIFASPTGFPFKVVQIPGTQSDSAVYLSRKRICDISALLVPYQQPNGKIGLCCPSEPVEDYLRKGGKITDTINRRCLCNGLSSASEFGSANELPIFTMGDDVSFLRHLMKDEGGSYTAEDAIKYLLP